MTEYEKSFDRVIHAIDAAEKAERAAIIQVAYEIGAANTMIHDLGLEISEKLDMGYDYDELVAYVDEVAPGSGNRINDLTKQNLYPVTEQ